MIGSVSATVGGKPVLFTLGPDMIWHVDRAEGVPDDALDRAFIAVNYVAETTRPNGPCPVTRAAEAIGGTPYVVPGGWQEDETARARGKAPLGEALAQAAA